jgi:hypothetical protein
MPNIARHGVFASFDSVLQRARGARWLDEKDAAGNPIDLAAEENLAGTS